MPLRATTVRFDARSYTLVQEEAQRAGMTVGQFIREATLIRAALRAVGDREGWSSSDIARAAQLCSEQLVELSRPGGDPGG